MPRGGIIYVYGIVSPLTERRAAQRSKGCLMEFDIKKQDSPNKENYAQRHIELAYVFSGKLAKEFGPFLKGIMIFGSSARRDKDADDMKKVIRNTKKGTRMKELLERFDV